MGLSWSCSVLVYIDSEVIVASGRRLGTRELRGELCPETGRGESVYEGN